MQGGLVGFDLGDQMNAGGGGLLECFFDNAWHRQRKRGEQCLDRRDFIGLFVSVEMTQH
jgi:hypothetical protein